MIWLMWYPVRIFINWLPKKFAYWMGCIGGIFLYLISKDKQKIMSNELHTILPNKTDHELNKIVKECFINFVLSEMEVLLYPSMNQGYIEKMVKFKGKEYLDGALKQGKGVLLFQAHFGAFQMVMPAIGYSGYTMNQISASASIWKESTQLQLQKKSYDIKASYEYKLPVKHIPVENNLKTVFNSLKRNEIVGITADGGGGYKTEEISFVGRKANFQVGGIKIARRTGAVMLPVFILTLKDFKHELLIHPPLKMDTSKPEETIIFDTLRSYVKLLEGYVYQYPSHYGYTLYLRKSRAYMDSYLFFDYYDIARKS